MVDVTMGERGEDTPISCGCKLRNHQIFHALSSVFQVYLFQGIAKLVAVACLWTTCRVWSGLA